MCYATTVLFGRVGEVGEIDPKALKQMEDSYHLLLLSYQALIFPISQHHEILSRQLIKEHCNP